uniref:Putative glucosidase ii beta subunit-like protein n=2 Tax=Culex tarsalis TaxID=7177 RepID=A0A1Q3FEB4_CULTA
MRKTWVKRDNIYYKPFYKQKLKMAFVLMVLMAFVFFGYQFFYISQLQTTESSAGTVNNRQMHHTNQPQQRHQQVAASSNVVVVPPPSHSVGNNEAKQLTNNAVQDEGGGGGGGGAGEDNRTADFRGPSEDARYVYVEKVGNYEKKILRGIRLRDLDAYHPGSSSTTKTTFRCLSSTRQIAWSRVNDDYCDCPEDGSDEPGTGACDRGRFYCRFQKRHATGRGGYTSVPSGWVNDGVCDCCDGSDEWLTTAAGCRNTCKEKFPY